MKAKFRGETLRGLVSVMSSVTDEIVMECKADGISAVAVDPAHVAMVGFRIDKECMPELEGTGEYGIDLKKLAAVLKLADRDESVDKEAEDGRMTVRVGNITRRMALLDTERMARTKVPDIELREKVPLTASELQQIVRAVADLGDAVTIRTEDHTLTVSSADDTQSAEFRAQIPGMTPGTAESTLPKVYIETAARAIPGHWRASIELSDDYPVRIAFGGYGWFLIAPRVEAEE